MSRALCVLAVALLAGPVVAWANPPCHSVVTADTDLTADLDCSAVDGDPLIAGADGVTVRLNGWTLTCPPGFVSSGGEADVEGIRASGYVGVKVLGPGKVTGCGRAVTFQDGSNDVVEGLYLSGNLTGIVFEGGSGHRAEGNVVVGNQGNGIELSSVTNAEVVGNVVTANGVTSDPSRGSGVTNDNASSAAISCNQIVGNLKNGISEGGASVLAATIESNVVLGNGGIDLNLRGTDDTVTDTACETSNPAGLCTHPLNALPDCSSTPSTSTSSTSTPTSSSTSTTLGGDQDGDGVADAGEACICLGTTSGATVTALGCSVDQLCPCSAPVGRAGWLNHADYVHCAKNAAKELLKSGRITLAERSVIGRTAAQSNCGHLDQ